MLSHGSDSQYWDNQEHLIRNTRFDVRYSRLLKAGAIKVELKTDNGLFTVYGLLLPNTLSMQSCHKIVLNTEIMFKPLDCFIESVQNIIKE